MSDRSRIDPLPAAAAHQPPTRRRRSLSLDMGTWQEASAKAKNEHLTGARVLEVLLLSYAAGRITLTARHVESGEFTAVGVTLADNAVAQAETRRQDDQTAGSLSELARRLLTGFNQGTITVTLTAQGNA
ncbi:hypothetical protein ABZ946_28795 [Streptomyces sp. NPDC046324]|uniref:hypothetical protein n=1 Tax=Streptomyces sp. NPDC046324 TaxID=3154915 RepID=UPI0033C78001